VQLKQGHFKRRTAMSIGFTSINWKNLKAIGAGSYGAVFTDGVYAVKFGQIKQYEIEMMQEYASYGLTVPIHFVNYRMYIPSRIRKILASFEIPCYGRKEEIDSYIDYEGYCGVVIMGIATPIVDPGIRKLDHENMSKCNRVIAYIHGRIQTLGVQDYFGDDHEYNIGIYNGNPVILDL
jgi:hypothetical protein